MCRPQPSALPISDSTEIVPRAAAAQREIGADPQLGDRLALGDHAHEVLRLEARQLGGERAHPDVVHAAGVQNLAFSADVGQVVQLALGEQDLLGVRLERDGQAAQPERAGAVGDLADRASGGRDARRRSCRW